LSSFVAFGLVVTGSAAYAQRTGATVDPSVRTAPAKPGVPVARIKLEPTVKDTGQSTRVQVRTRANTNTTERIAPRVRTAAKVPLSTKPRD
jgi:hypothetical protein